MCKGKNKIEKISLRDRCAGDALDLKEFRQQIPRMLISVVHMDLEAIQLVVRRTHG